MDIMLASNAVEKLLNTNEWQFKTPYLNFGKDIEVCPIFPFLGAQARLKVRSAKDHNRFASIYLDTHSVLGIQDEPYWEVMLGDCYRYSLKQTDKMVDFIRNEILKNPKKKKSKLHKE